MDDQFEIRMDMGDIDLGLESTISSSAQPQADDFHLLAPPNSGGGDFNIPDCLVSPRVIIDKDKDQADNENNGENEPDVLIDVQEKEDKITFFKSSTIA